MFKEIDGAAFELAIANIKDIVGNTLQGIEAVSLEQFNGAFLSVLVIDLEIMKHDVITKRVELEGDEYLHAIARVSGNEIEFEPLPYKPSQYPQLNICDLSLYEFDDGTEQKLWAIKDAGNNQAHVFYQNNQTEQRLVYQLVNLGTSSAPSRISQKLQNGYRVVSDTALFVADSRLIEPVPF